MSARNTPVGRSREENDGVMALDVTTFRQSVRVKDSTCKRVATAIAYLPRAEGRSRSVFAESGRSGFGHAAVMSERSADLQRADVFAIGIGFKLTGGVGVVDVEVERFS